MLPPYKYAPLPPDNIRLLRILDASKPDQISCSLEHHPRDSAEYTALSYCWGNPAPVASIRVRNRRIDIAANLWSFLQTWSDQPNSIPRHPDLLWIDAICINQKDLQEKSVQVQKMWFVYEKADLVVAWLGTDSKSTSTAFRILNGIGSLTAPPYSTRTHSRRPKHEELSLSILKTWMRRKLAGHERSMENAKQDLIDLTHHNYFSRAWIYQEISTATNVILLCGPDWCSLYDFDLLLGGPDPGKTMETQRDELNYLVTLFSRGLAWDWKNESGPGPGGAAEVLQSTLLIMSPRKCDDPRDRIFASLNLFPMRSIGPTLNLEVDYTLSNDGLFVLVLSSFDHCVARSDRAWSDDDIMEVVDDLATALDTELDSEEFFPWFETRLYTCATGVMAFIGGRTVDCSGRIISDLLSQGPIYCAYAQWRASIGKWRAKLTSNSDLGVEYISR